MINADRNMVKVSGNHIILLSNLTMIVKSLKLNLTKEYGDEDKAEYMIRKSFELGLQDDEEIEKKAKDLIAQKLETSNGLKELIETLKMLERI